MPNKMLIDAVYDGETRIVVLEDSKIQEFDVENSASDRIVHNVYLGRVERVEPGLEAAFVNYGADRHGFLPFRAIHRDYYLTGDDSTTASNQAGGKGATEAANQEDAFEERVDLRTCQLLEEFRDYRKDFSAVGMIEKVSESARCHIVEPALSARPSRTRQTKGRKDNSATRKRIEDAIKVGQILMVQISKDELNEKGAALTTFISLPGRYCVLLPNNSKGCVISSKITSTWNRKKLKNIYTSLKVPDGASVIMRTAGHVPKKDAIKKDYDRLVRLWQDIVGRSRKSFAPAVLFEEGNLISRVIRDLYNDKIQQIVVEGDSGYEMASRAMNAMMPDEIHKLQKHSESTPLFVKERIEKELSNIYFPRVELKSGGHVVIQQTEALVSIDVNSAKANRSSTVEDTALQTNLEAAAEIARQLRLRDLAGIIVIDFIDMAVAKNRTEVHKKLNTELGRDRARVSTESISNLGLLEMTRQRLRRGVSGNSTQHCPNCSGTGQIVQDETFSIGVLRHIEAECSSARKPIDIVAQVPVRVANFLLNERRAEISRIQNRYAIMIRIEGGTSLLPHDYEIRMHLKQSGKLISTSGSRFNSARKNSLKPKGRYARKQTAQARNKVNLIADDFELAEGTATSSKQGAASTDGGPEKTSETASDGIQDRQSPAQPNRASGRDRPRYRKQNGKQRVSRAALKAGIRSGTIDTGDELSSGNGHQVAPPSKKDNARVGIANDRSSGTAKGRKTGKKRKTSTSDDISGLEVLDSRGQDDTQRVLAIVGDSKTGRVLFDQLEDSVAQLQEFDRIGQLLDGSGPGQDAISPASTFGQDRRMQLADHPVSEIESLKFIGGD